MTSAPPCCLAYAWTQVCPPPGQTCEITIEQLWGDYLVLGGSMSLPAFRRTLGAEVIVGDGEHDKIAQALNEHLHEHGHRFPVPYLRQRPTEETRAEVHVRRGRARHRFEPS